jgi:hypothetical protein
VESVCCSLFVGGFEFGEFLVRYFEWQFSKMCKLIGLGFVRGTIGRFLL